MPFSSLANFSARTCFLNAKLSCELSDHYRKRGSASYIVREVHSVRERERERERERYRERERKTEVTSPLSR